MAVIFTICRLGKGDMPSFASLDVARLLNKEQIVVGIEQFVRNTRAEFGNFSPNF